MPPGDYVMLVVSDSGCGMDEEIRARLFEPFFTTKEPGKGTGLGLATVYGIVQQSGGYIWVYSEVGLGTTFKIYLPRASDATRATFAFPGESTPPLQGTETILLVEDAPQVRALTFQVLSRSGYTVLQAANGAEAVTLAAQFPESIDLLVTDIVMPGMNGRALADKLRRQRPGLRVLLMSGWTDDGSVDLGMPDPATPFLEKPFTPQALARKVQDVIDGPSPPREGAYESDPPER